MLKPNGSFSKSADPLVLLNIWARHLDRHEENLFKQKMIFAGIGKPSYFLNEDVAKTAMDYWSSNFEAIRLAKSHLTPHLSPEKLTDEISKFSTAIDYDLPGGTEEAKQIMALGLTNWYGPTIAIKPDELIFTVGGFAGLTMLFRILREKDPKGKIITPSPYYPFYNVEGHQNNLQTINVLNKEIYGLTAEVVKEAIEQAEKNHDTINAFLFCDPYNPLGSVVGEQEWTKIASLLRKTPKHIPIILDEAYSELTFFSRHISLLQVAPDLKDRIIILRSGTKGFSASGERLAVLICPDEEIREKLSDETILSYLHAPKSQQIAYARGMFALTEEKRRNLAEHYYVQVKYVQERLRKMGIALPEKAYHVEGTFYVIADLSSLFHQQIPPAAERALGKGGLITTDVDISYSLLFEDRVMISPLSFFGSDPRLGYLRITCSGGVSILSELLDRIEKKLKDLRIEQTRRTPSLP